MDLSVLIIFIVLNNSAISKFSGCDSSKHRKCKHFETMWTIEEINMFPVIGACVVINMDRAAVPVTFQDI